MTERSPRIYRNDIIASMDTQPIPAADERRFTAPGFEDATTKIDLNKAPEKIRRALSLNALDAMSRNEQRDELNTTLRNGPTPAEEQSSPDFQVEKINVAAIRENLGLSAVRSTVSDDLRQTSMHVDGVRPGKVSPNSRARREELMRKARKSKLV